MLNLFHDLFATLAAGCAPLAAVLENDGMWLIYLLLAAGIFLSTGIHEYGHAWVADRLGDPTPRAAGRVTLAPWAHMDGWGTLMIIASALIGMPVGWGKPVKTDPDLYNVDRRTGIALVALGGPFMSLLGAVLLAVPARALLYLLTETRLDPTAALVVACLFIINAFVILTSLSLAIFNLLPLYPLDGAHVLATLLPQDLSVVYTRLMKRYGMYLFLGLMGTEVLSKLIAPLVIGLFRWLVGI